MCFCCTSLRGVAYFLVNVHMLGSLALGALSTYVYFFRPLEIPPGLEDVNPLFIKNFPLLLGGYAGAAAFFSCFIYRAIDMESLFQLTWSVVSFGGFQFLVIFFHFIFSVMFRDLVGLQWQILIFVVLIANCTATVVYLTLLFLFAKKIHSLKDSQNVTKQNSIGNNLGDSGVKKDKKKKKPEVNLQNQTMGTQEEGNLEGVTVEPNSPPSPPTVPDVNEENEEASAEQDSPPPSYPNP